MCYINKILKSLTSICPTQAMKPNGRPSCLSIYCNNYVYWHSHNLTICPAGIIENFVPETTDPTLVSCNNTVVWPNRKSDLGKYLVAIL